MSCIRISRGDTSVEVDDRNKGAAELLAVARVAWSYTAGEDQDGDEDGDEDEDERGATIVELRPVSLSTNFEPATLADLGLSTGFSREPG